MDAYDTVKELEIISYQANGDYHVCRDDEARTTVYIDLMVEGTIPIPEGKDYIEFCKSLAGKRVRIDSSHAHLQLASNPKILGAAQNYAPELFDGTIDALNKLRI
tara:strand:- start:912 stop:1226 length:315 start_codon:yes stop_codon:yes gene_type:complete